MRYLAFILAAGCAATVPTQHSRDLYACAGGMPASAWFPAQVSEATLPRVDEIAMHLEAIGRDDMRARLHVCVSPDGSAEAQLVAPTGVPAFDDAVVRDVSDWKFEPSSRGMCKLMTVRYKL